ILVVAYRATTPEQRKVASQAALARARAVKEAASRPRPDTEAFREELCARTSRALVTPAIVAVNAAVFLLMVFGPGALSDPATVIRWGGNVGPRTTNGEWWRVFTAMFIHSGLFQLLINIVGLLQLGLMLERI